MPNFFDHLPDYKIGHYKAEVFLLVPEFGFKSTYHKIFSKEFSDKRKAYLWARFVALFRDWTTRITLQDYGVAWEIIDLSNQ